MYATTYPFSALTPPTLKSIALKKVRSMMNVRPNTPRTSYSPIHLIYIIRARTRERNTRTTAVYLERFFRNLLLGGKWYPRNRFLHINTSDEWKVQPNLAYATSTPVRDKDSLRISIRLGSLGKRVTDTITMKQVLAPAPLSIVVYCW